MEKNNAFQNETNTIGQGAKNIYFCSKPPYQDGVTDEITQPYW